MQFKSICPLQVAEHVLICLPWLSRTFPYQICKTLSFINSPWVHCLASCGPRLKLPAWNAHSASVLPPVYHGQGALSLLLKLTLLWGPKPFGSQALSSPILCVPSAHLSLLPKFLVSWGKRGRGETKWLKLYGVRLWIFCFHFFFYCCHNIQVIISFYKNGVTVASSSQCVRLLPQLPWPLALPVASPGRLRAGPQASVSLAIP